MVQGPNQVSPFRSCLSVTPWRAGWPLESPSLPRPLPPLAEAHLRNLFQNLLSFHGKNVLTSSIFGRRFYRKDAATPQTAAETTPVPRSFSPHQPREAGEQVEGRLLAGWSPRHPWLRAEGEPRHRRPPHRLLGIQGWTRRSRRHLRHCWLRSQRWLACSPAAGASSLWTAVSRGGGVGAAPFYLIPKSF